MRSGEGQGRPAQTLSAAIAEFSKALTDKGVCNVHHAMRAALSITSVGCAYEEREITSDCMGVLSAWDITSQGIKGSRNRHPGRSHSH